VIDRESNRTDRWIGEAIHITKEQDKSMNQDEGFYQLPHIYDYLLFVGCRNVNNNNEYKGCILMNLSTYLMSHHCCLLQTSMLLVKANDTKSCFPPLVVTKREISWYLYVDGCGLQCENVLYTEADHAHAHLFILITGLSCFFCTLFTVVGRTFIIIGFCFIYTINFWAFFDFNGSGCDIECDHFIKMC